MGIENEETIDDTPTDVDSADEGDASTSPADEPSSADSATEGESAEQTDEVEETPEQKAEREKAERKAARLKSADDAEKKAAAAREARRKQREDQEREETIRAREQQANAVLQQAQSLIADLEKRAEAVRRGGFDALKALGIDYGDWTKQTLEDTSPEAELKRALKRVDDLEARDRQREEQSKQAREREERQASAKRFESYVDESAEDFPDAADLPPRLLHSFADEVAHEFHRETGRYPSFAHLLPRLDKKAKEFHDEQKKRSALRTRSKTPPAEAPGTTLLANPSGRPATPPANRTLDPATAVTRSKAPRQQMTPEEEDEWALNELRQAMAADSKSVVT